MESLFRYVAPPSQCGYLPSERWSLEYEMVANLSAQEYAERLEEGWRRFGAMMFRPQCPACQACQSLRVDTARFRPNRSQRRAWKANVDDIEVRIGPPTAAREKLRLYDRFHAFQTDSKGWPEHPPKDVSSYRESFVHNPAFTEEWCYYLRSSTKGESDSSHLVGVGYVDRMRSSMSAIYFFYDPAVRARSLGTFNVLCLLDQCRRRGLPWLYLGYYVKGCRSLEYKGNFRPNQVRNTEGAWRDFLK